MYGVLIMNTLFLSICAVKTGFYCAFIYTSGLKFCEGAREM